MERSIFTFSADHRDGRVYLGGKMYPAGTFAVHLLNQYYLNDTAARLSVFRDETGFHIRDQLRHGYLNIDEFQKTGANTLEALKALPKLRPFDTLDRSAITQRVTDLFTEENGERICQYFFDRADISTLSQAEIHIGMAYRRCEDIAAPEAETLIGRVDSVLAFFDHIGDDLYDANRKLRAFVARLDEAERFDETHLLPLAMEIFGPMPFPVTEEYTSLKKNKASGGMTVARHLTFDRYLAFALTDFFEGLHHGHYPRRCGICGRFFLMQSARRQQYCTGMSPYVVRGRRLTCQKYAAYTRRKELAANDPVSALYTNRCSAIRVEVRRGTIPPEMGAAAKALALEHKQTALRDDAYARQQYAKDMERVKLYRDAELLLLREARP